MERTVQLIWSDIKEPFLEFLKDFWLFLKAQISYLNQWFQDIYVLNILKYLNDSYLIIHKENINQANGHFDLETFE